jgi:PST family polysaccharide transporter
MQKTQNPTLKRLTDNFFSLVVLQFINYLLPLLLIPYLVRVLGIDGFGIYNFILAVIMYGIHISDYGFDLTATYHISKNRNKPSKINKIVSAVLSIKLLIAFGYLIIIVIASFFVEKLYEYQEVLFLGFGLLLGHLLFPLWFFQGVEKMRYIMYLNGFAKLLFVASVFIFVHTPEDLYLVMLLNAVSSIFIGIVALYIVFTRFNITFKRPKWVNVVYYLKDGWYVFTSKFAVQLYTTVNIIILSFFATPLVIGFYAIAIKIIHALGSLLEPLTRAVYPYLVKVQQNSNEAFVKRNQQLALVILAVMLPVSFFVGYFAEEILYLISGEEAQPLNVEILQVFAISLIVYLYGSQFTNMLVTIKETKFLNLIVFTTAGINIIFAPILLYFFGVMGMVWLSVGLAFFLTLSKGFFLIRYFKNLQIQ